MKRTVILSIILLLLTSMSFAQQDVNAEKILTKMSKTYKEYNSFRVEFSLTVENKEENINDSSIGVADIKGDRYKISIMGADTYFDGRTRYTYLKDSEEVNISEPDNDDNEIANPAKIFDMYKNGFGYKLVKQYKEAEINIAEIELVPSHEKEYSKIVLKINIEKSKLISFTSFGLDGNNLIIEMSKLETMHDFDDSHFVFDAKAFPDAEIIDMR
jgi:outer membrane lipoprotein-sorting protein